MLACLTDALTSRVKISFLISDFYARHRRDWRARRLAYTRSSTSTAINAHEVTVRQTTPVMAHTDLALEEALDEQDPLRHLRNDDERDIVPVQPPSVHNQTLELTFPTPGSVNADDVDKVSIRLLVDASPGCGGIAWPAGEVGLPRNIMSRFRLDYSHEK